VSVAGVRADALGTPTAKARPYAPKHIRSNVIMPGLMKTPMIVEPFDETYGGGSVHKMMEVRDGQCLTGHIERDHSLM
jgi:hypothetical protein